MFNTVFKFSSNVSGIASKIHVYDVYRVKCILEIHVECKDDILKSALPSP